MIKIPDLHSKGKDLALIAQAPWTGWAFSCANATSGGAQQLRGDRS